ncbi:MAG: NUDIX hydrolase [Patescibacteria group bacterium]
MIKVVNKVMMFIYRVHDGEKQFYMLSRPNIPAKDSVVPTGHIGDVIAGEKSMDAAVRELEEELGAEPLSIRELDYKVETLLNMGRIRSLEQAFIIEVADQDYPFLEYEGVDHSWQSLNELEKLLTYESQFSAVTEIRLALGTK